MFGNCRSHTIENDADWSMLRLKATIVESHSSVLICYSSTLTLYQNYFMIKKPLNLLFYGTVYRRDERLNKAFNPQTLWTVYY